MKKFATLTSLCLLWAMFTVPVFSQDTGTVSTADENVVKVYYFHATGRCATCVAVEEVTQVALKEFYGKKVPFESINREKDKDNPLIAKHKVVGQTLLVISGEKVVNLTNDAFLNARTKPEKLREKLKSTIDSMLDK